MNRSSRIRKPSQKAREIAEAALLLSSKPSSTDPSKIKPPSQSSNRRTLQPGSNGSSGRAKVKIGSRRGRATINSNGDVDVEEEAVGTNSTGVAAHSGAAGQDSATESAHASDLETAQDPEVLYCICLGHDDHTPMIQCEGCENWFHFSCIQLDPAEASEIAAFYCQVCHASGTGVTLKVNEETAAPEAMPETTPQSIPNSPQTTGEKSPVVATISDTIPEQLSSEQVPCPPASDPVPCLPASESVPCPPASESVDLHPEKKIPVSGSPQVPKRSSSDSSTESSAHSNQPAVDGATPYTLPSKSSRRKPKSAEGLSGDEDTSDQDFTGDDSLRVADRKRKTPTSMDSRPSTQPRISVSTPFSTTPPTPTTPVLGAEKTRRTCAEQFFKLFEPIFYNKFKQDEGDAQEVELRSRSEDVAMRFSDAVEAELFENFGEPDPHNQKAPRRQYINKLRSLLFNLKNNPSFLNSLSSLDLSPRLIVCMSHEDLQTPQQKALAEQIRQRSLHDSVKTRVPGLELIITHKADEAVVASSFHPAAAEKKVATDNTALPSNPFSLPTPYPQDPLSQPKSPVAAKPSGLATDLKPVDAEGNAQPTVSESRQAENPSPKDLTSNNLLGSFDLEKVFAAIRSVPASLTASADPRATKPKSVVGESQKEAKEGDSDDSMDLENTQEREVAGNSQAATRAGTRRSSPDDYDPFFVLTNGVDADLDAILHGDTMTAPPSRSTKQLEPQTVAVSNLEPIVWTGNVMTADAGGFAACAVQVGGRSLSPDGFTLGKILPPDTMTVVGRLSVKDSTNYLVQNHFAPTRELVILDLRPNLKGPPELPSPERVIQHKQNLIEFFTKKGRHAVVAVNDKVKQTVRDIYLVPILRHEPLPEFVQLLDNVSIPESVPRDHDMMIAVLVLSKGVVPSAWKPASSNPIETFNPGLAPPHHAQAAPSSGSTASAADAQRLPASTHASSLAPGTSPYPGIPVQSMSTSGPMDPIPLLQSYNTHMTSGSNPLPFSLLSQLPPSVSTTTPPGPPPGFVPYVAPRANLPPASSSNASINALDLSKVDVSALQALLLNQQALRPILNQPPSQPPPHPQPQAHSQALPQPPNLPLPPPTTQRNGRSLNNTTNGPRNSNQPSTLPTPPRPANLPLNPNFAHHHPYQSMSPQHQHQSWSTPDQQHRPLVLDSYPSNNKDNSTQQTKGLMRMGEVIRSSPNNEETHRRRGQLSGSPAAGHHRGGGGGGGRSKRHSHEFVAPPRDGGWAGRGRVKKT